MKDTVHKAPLMLHLVELVVEKFPDASNLYSDLPNVHRVAKVTAASLSLSLSLSLSFGCSHLVVVVVMV